MGNFGSLFLDGELIARTCEREWLNNHPKKSCIPEGTYAMTPYESPSMGLCYALVNPELGVTLESAPGKRAHIVLQAGNFPVDVEGSIALGTTWHASSWGVKESRRAIFKFNEEFGLHKGLEHTLTITRLL
ncbi:DUF5675 family protein [Aeromonas caviae]|uniref:DUF5675 family protein n=1 Tax=Aeromonas caviae TaxID=648 RepID=UPI003522259E